MRSQNRRIFPVVVHNQADATSRGQIPPRKTIDAPRRHQVAFGGICAAA